LVRFLGSGGFGEVWQATGPGGFHVALKFLLLGHEAGDAELRALEVVKHIRYAHLLPLFGAWRRDNLFIIAMELADKALLARLHEVCDQGLPGIPRDELLGCMRDAAQGIDHLNAAGIQHRDVKPHNLLLVGGSVKVADFGLAKVLQRTVASHSGAMTVAYAAPECFKETVTRNSDQYSLGISYCQLRGGRLPFEGNGYQVMAGHLLNAPDLSMLPEAERPAVARALAKSPEDRWPCCRHFVEALLSSRSPPPTPSGVLRLLCAAQLALEAGGSALLEVRVQRENCQGAVQLDLLGLPEGLAAEPVILDPDQELAQLGVKAGAAAPAATLAARLRARLGAVESHQAVTVVVTVPPRPRLLLPEVATLEPGQRMPVARQLERQDCPGPVELPSEQLPLGISASPYQVTEGDSTGHQELDAGADAAPASHLVAEGGDTSAGGQTRPRVAISDADRTQLVVEIKRLKGKFEVDEAVPGEPIVALDLRGSPVGDEELAILEGLPQLRKLDLGQCPALTDAGLTHLEGLTQLRELELNWCRALTDAGLAHVGGLVQLEKVALHACEALTGAELAHLNRLAQLRELDLGGCSALTDAGLAHLAGLPRLQKLGLWGCRALTDAGLACLNRLPQLRELDLRQCEAASDAGLAHLARLSRLQRLDLWGCEGLTDAGLAHLKGLTQLQGLNLGRCPGLTDAGLAHLRGLTQLQELELWGCPGLTDAGLAHLAGLTQLRELALDGCEAITDAGLVYLRGLTELALLNVRGTQVSQSRAQDLQEALPGLDIRRGL
jgi:hypothetical protein